MTDKQLALAAIESLNKARDLLESSTDQAQHDIAEDIGMILTQIESLTFFDRPLRGLCTVCTDYDVPAGQPGRYVITEERPVQWPAIRGYYIVLARFKKLADAKRYLEKMS